MIRHLPATLALVLAAAPVVADEFTDTLQSALKAYEEGDVDGASADLEYAGKLLTAMKAESLAALLPAALPGWTRAEADAAESSGFMGMLGGGTAAAATYTKGTDELTITLVALGNGDGTFKTAALVLGNFGVQQGWNSDDTFHRTVADVNGDGFDDIIGFGVNGTVVALSKGDGSFGDAQLVLGNFGSNQGWSSQI